MNRLHILACVAFGSAACNPFAIFHTTESYNSCHWYLKNETSEPVYVRCCQNNGEVIEEVLLYKGDSTRLQFYGVDLSLDFSFEMLYDNMYSDEEDQYLRAELLSEEGTLLKSWPYTLPEPPVDRFYEEASWHYYHPHEHTHVWVFDLLPEDLAPADDRNP